MCDPPQTEHWWEQQKQTERRNCRKWLIKSCRLSNLYHRLLPQTAADVTAASLHLKGCNLFAEQNFVCRAKRTLSLQRKAFENTSCRIRWHFSRLVEERGRRPASCARDKRRSPCSPCLRREKEMKRSRLIETKSTPCLCELPFSWLKTLYCW